MPEKPAPLSTEAIAEKWSEVEAITAALEQKVATLEAERDRLAAELGELREERKRMAEAGTGVDDVQASAWCARAFEALAYAKGNAEKNEALTTRVRELEERLVDAQNAMLSVDNACRFYGPVEWAETVRTIARDADEIRAARASAQKAQGEG